MWIHYKLSKSHRYINFEKTKELLSIKKNKTKYVGVLVKPKTEELEMFSELNFDYFQIYDVYNKEALIDIKEVFKKIDYCDPGDR